MKSYYILPLILIFAVLSCNNPTEKKELKLERKYVNKPLVITPNRTIPINLNDSTINMLIEKGDNLKKQMLNTYQVELRNAIKRDGIEGAIEFCNLKAMNISDSASYAEQAVIR
ncbi:MAG: hypothetical protein C0598_04825, partial [Marinilabiliales bacterium]